MKMTALILSWVLTVTGISAQQYAPSDQLLDAFAAYSKLPREVAYVHLNKSILIKGEELGFKAYVMDKDNKRPSMETRNLYCVISDSANRILKSKMLLIKDGMGNGSFKLDSLFTTGNYVFRAYTNWMLNFSEPNYFEQQVNIIDPETDEFLPNTNMEGDPDIQFLPEGGQAVIGLEAVFGVIAKDPTGFGVPNLEGSIIDESGLELTRFKVNQFGIGRFGLLLGSTNRYYAKFQYKDKAYQIPLPAAFREGIVLKLTDLKDRIGLNMEMIPGPQTSRDGIYHLSIHDGDELKVFPISFADDTKQLKIIPKEDLYQGINVITLMDQASRPLLERLYFNNVGFEFHNAFENRAVVDSSYVVVNLNIPGLDPQKFSSLSLSVLPEETYSYLGHHNLPSYTLLQPYVKGAIQNASYYFQNINPRKQYELDNLLITQGWSSYSWNKVVNQAPEYRFDFEKGISFTMRFNKRQSDEFYIYPTSIHPPKVIKLKQGELDFTVEEFYLWEGEKLAISEISEYGDRTPPGAALSFKPSGIPKYSPNFNIALPNRLNEKITELELPPISFENIERLQLLEEVVVTQERSTTRMEKLKDRSNGNLDFFGVDDPRRNQFLSNYLSGRGFIVSENLGRVSITARNPNTPNNARPIVYLDGVLLTDFTLLYRFPLSAVDYIEINKSGIGSGIMGGGGVIRIVTDTKLLFGRRKGGLSFNEYDIPLAYPVMKRFYSPVYPSYTSTFFRRFGTVDWLPDIRPDSNGNIRLQIKDYGLERFKVFVEGIVNDNAYAIGSFYVMPGADHGNSH